MRYLSAYETGASHDDHLAPRSQRWGDDDSGADAKAKLASRGQLQCACQACREGYSSIHRLDS